MSCNVRPTSTDTDSSTPAPTGFGTVSININSFSPATNSAAVTLGLTASNATDMYITETAGCSIGGAWETYNATKSFTLTHLNTLASVYFKVRKGTTESSCVSASIVHDNILPTVAWSAPVDGTTVNSSNVTALTLSGTCSENGVNVVLTGAISQSLSCTAGSFSHSFDFSSAADGALTVNLAQTDEAGNVSAPATLHLVKDSTAPTLTLTSLASGGTINAANVSAITLTGTCSENGQNVIITGALSSSTPCASGAWTQILDFSGVSDGSVTVHFNLSDAAGNPAPQVSATYTKDVAPPSSNSIAINSGALYTTSTSVTLTLASTGATDMYITEDVTCTAGGVWEPLSNTKAWTLSVPESLDTVYAVFRDAAGNTSSCVNASITDDTMPPVWTDVPTYPSVYSSLTDSPPVSYTESAVDSASGVQKYQYAIGSGTSGASLTDLQTWTDVSGGSFQATGLSLFQGGSYYVNMKVIDNAGFETILSGAAWTADTTPPALAVTAPTNNQRVTELDIKVSGNCDSAYLVNISYGAGITGPASTTCTSAVYSFYIELSGATGTRTFSVSQTDGALNTTTITNNLDYRKDPNIMGQVLTSLELADGSRIYGGSFTGVSTGRQMYAVRAAANGTVDTSFDIGSGFNGQIYAISALSDGSLIFAGDFTKYRNRTAIRIAKISTAGLIDTTFSPQIGSNGANNIVRALWVDASDNIYLGGDFTTYRGTTVNRIAKINSSGVLDTTFTGTGTVGVPASIYALAGNSTDLYAGGSFVTYRGAPANRIAKLNAGTGVLDTTFSPPTGPNGANNIVRAIALYGADILVGGDFTAYMGTTLGRLARVSTAGVLDTTFFGTTGVNSSVNVIVVNNPSVFIGGAFTTYAGSVVNYLMKLGATGAVDTTFNPTTGGNGVNSAVSAISINGGYLYVGGAFNTYRAVAAPRVAKISLTGTRDLTFNAGNGPSSSLTAIYATGGGIYLGGPFVAYGTYSTANYIAKFAADGSLDTSFNPQGSPNGFNNVVRTLALNGTTLYAGGSFTTYRGAAANRVAKLSTAGVLDTTFNPPAGPNGANNVIWAIQLSGSDIFIGGDLTAYRGVSLKYLAKLNSAGVLDATFSTTNGPSSSVYAIATDGTNLFIGGNFTTYNTAPANRVAKVDYSTAALDTVFSPGSGANGVNNKIYSLILQGSNLYMGGAFTTYRGTTVNYVAKSSFTGVLDTTFKGAGTVGFSTTVNSLTSDGTNLYVAGLFTTYRGASSPYLAKLDLTSGVLSATFGLNGSITGPGVTGSSVNWTGTALLVGGLFNTYKGQTYLNKLILDSSGNP
jgi:uncharacterized delta-60 repeat protein